MDFLAYISNIIMVQQTLHHLNSQECAWAFLRIKDLFFEKGPMPLHYNMRMHYEKRVGKSTPSYEKTFDCVKNLRWKIETKTRTQESY